MFDLFDRDIHYLRISVTDKCNLRCRYCMPEAGVTPKAHEDLLSFEQIRDIAREAAAVGFDKIRLTGGEPLVRRGIADLVSLIRKIPEIRFIGLTTNGILLPRHARELKDAGLDALNISLDSLDPAVYSQITRCGSLDDALQGIQAALAAGFTGTKINMVVARETTGDDLAAMEKFCAEKGLILQKIRQYSLMETKTDDMNYHRPPPCGGCNRLRLTCDGYLKPCLHSDQEIKVDFLDIRKSLESAVHSKPYQGDVCSSRDMTAIGG